MAKCDSPKQGIYNEAALCYMNSFIQMLYHLKIFREYIFNNKLSNSMIFELKRQFIHMEYSKKPTSLAKLVEVFGWNRENTFVQQDIQEFCCILIDKLETIFKAPNETNIIKYLFGGSTESLVECRHIDFKSGREENFIDIQLSLKSGQKLLTSLKESINDFLQKEPLDGENQYDTEQFGKQDADKRVRFKKLPKVLMFHLRRCEYDYMLEINKKIKHRFEFPQEIDMNEFKDPELQTEGKHNYKLFGIFVHHGNDGLAGHYTVFLKDKDGWTEFDDENSKKVDWEFVKNNSYGGESMEYFINKEIAISQRNRKNVLHAYMLIYVEEQSFNQIINCESSEEKIKIEKCLKNICIDEKIFSKEQNPEFILKCLKDNSIYELMETIKKSNYRNLLENVTNIHLISPIQILGEPCGIGPFVGIDHQILDSMVQNRKNLIFKKKINENYLKDFFIQSNNNYFLKAKLIQENCENDLLSQTPNYLNTFPGESRNVLLNDIHVVPFEMLSELKDSFVSFEQLFPQNQNSQLEIVFYVSKFLSNFSLKKHLLSVILSSSYRKLFGLNFAEIDEKLYLNQENSNYIDFNLISSENLEKIFSLFDFYLIDYENPNPLKKLDLESETKFISSILFDEEVFLVPILKNFKPISLNSLIPQSLQKNFDIVNDSKFSTNLLSRFGDSQFYIYNAKEMLTTNILIPMMDEFKLKENKTLEQSFSNNISVNQNINYLISLVQQEPLEKSKESVNILLKIFNPSLSVFVSHSILKFKKNCSNDELIETLTNITNIKKFYIFVEKIDHYFHNAPTFNFVLPDDENTPTSLLREIICKKLKISTYESEIQIIGDLKNKSVHNIYLIPSIESLFPELYINFDMVEKETEQKNQTPTNELNGEKKIQKINVDDESNDKIIKKPRNELKLSILYMNLTFIISANNLFHKFRYLISFRIQDQEYKIRKKLFFKEIDSQENLGKLIYFKIYKEKKLYNQLLKDEHYINGHFFYGNLRNYISESEKDFSNLQNIVSESKKVGAIKINLWMARRKRWLHRDLDINENIESSSLKSDLFGIYKELDHLNFRKTSSLSGDILTTALQISAHLRSLMNDSQEKVPLPEKKIDDIKEIIIRVKDYFSDLWKVEKKNLDRASIIPYIHNDGENIFCSLILKQQEFRLNYIPYNNVFPVYYFKMKIPDDSFITKEHLISKMIYMNSGLHEALIKDETIEEGKIQPVLSWSNNLKLNKFFNYKERDPMNFEKDLMDLEEFSFNENDIPNNLNAFNFEEIFEIYRLDIFNCNLEYKMIIFVDEYLDATTRKNLPAFHMVKIIGMSPAFLISILKFYDKHRSETNKINYKKYLKVLKRMRKDCYDLISISNNNTLQTSIPENAVNFNEKYKFFKMVTIFINNLKEKFSFYPKFMLLPSELSFMESLPIITKFLSSVYPQYDFTDKENIEIASINGMNKFEDCMFQSLDSEYQEDNIVKFIFNIKN